MTTLVASAEATSHAPADTVMEVLRDFRTHHPRILPPAFSDFSVEEGGYGAGTVTRFKLTLGGRTQEGRTRVDEPAPNVMREQVIGRDMTTIFTVVPAGSTSITRIETRWQPMGGLNGLLERVFAPRMLERVYRDELARLDAYVQQVVSMRG